MTRPDLTHLYFLLDRSGSMQSIKSDIEGGFAAFVDEQRRASGEALLAGKVSLRSAGAAAGLTENAVPPRLARTQTLGAYANEDGRVTAAGVERAKYDHESGTPKPAPAPAAAPMRFKPRRPK